MKQNVQSWLCWCSYILLIGLILTFPSKARSADMSQVTQDSVFKPFAVLLERHVVEKTLENDGLVSAFDYQAALDDTDTQGILECDIK